ncbi:MAG: hypothetical protein IT496_12370 [Gammaproteobacteria bacterium]|nr:hypothetical protein [Gammaproteobacteria bacterium]MCG3144080.1 hypothetical protein [Gammaproteobacteria bacterium]
MPQGRSKSGAGTQAGAVLPVVAELPDNEFGALVRMLSDRRIRVPLIAIAACDDSLTRTRLL